MYKVWKIRLDMGVTATPRYLYYSRKYGWGNDGLYVTKYKTANGAHRAKVRLEDTMLARAAERMMIVSEDKC